MEKTVKSATLSNAYITTSTDTIKNMVDIHCLSVTGINTISIDNVKYTVLGQDKDSVIISHYVGYGGTYKIEAQDGGGGQVQCMMIEYSDSPTLNFMTGGEFFLIGTILLYFFFFFLGIKLSFWR